MNDDHDTLWLALLIAAAVFGWGLVEALAKSRVFA